MAAKTFAKWARKSAAASKDPNSDGNPTNARRTKIGRTSASAATAAAMGRAESREEEEEEEWGGGGGGIGVGKGGGVK